MPCEQAECLYVEQKGRRGALGPKLGNFGSRHRVVAAVDFHHWKLRRVIAQAILGAGALSRVKAPRRDEALGGPRGVSGNYIGDCFHAASGSTVNQTLSDR